MVAAGAEHSAAVTEAGEVYGWGWGRYGNLGLGDRNDRLVPEKVSSIDVCPQLCGSYIGLIIIIVSFLHCLRAMIFRLLFANLKTAFVFACFLQYQDC